MLKNLLEDRLWARLQPSPLIQQALLFQFGEFPSGNYFIQTNPSIPPGPASSKGERSLRNILRFKRPSFKPASHQDFFARKFTFHNAGPQVPKKWTCHETSDDPETKESCSGKNLSLSKRERSPNKLALLYDKGRILYYATLQPDPA